ncbi:hypothetical protein, partial [Flavobacterium sp. 270]|uniref:hypothetical protein n=1 Tax=Flavobacterium sp. 270 TaxID=2512114 RepID=UPI001AB025B2
PIPNRVVKPACADGTAVLWESMSSPFFEKPYPYRIGFFVFRNVWIFFRSKYSDYLYKTFF